MIKYFPTSKRNGCDPLYKGRITSLSQMNYFALFFFVLSALSASATQPTVRHYKSSREAFEGPDRTITWRAWKEASRGEFRVRTGDRYLGGQVWEHYLGVFAGICKNPLLPNCAVSLPWRRQAQPAIRQLSLGGLFP